MVAYSYFIPFYDPRVVAVFCSRCSFCICSLYLCLLLLLVVVGVGRGGRRPGCGGGSGGARGLIESDRII